MTPIVYTPVVALGCQQFSKIYRRPRGLFVSYPLRGSIPSLLRNRPHLNVDIIVVTDGERIGRRQNKNEYLGSSQMPVCAERDSFAL
jgi:malic enzyme